jgi:hypothetical protein
MHVMYIIQPQNATTSYLVKRNENKAIQTV